MLTSLRNRRNFIPFKHIYFIYWTRIFCDHKIDGFINQPTILVSMKSKCYYNHRVYWGSFFKNKFIDFHTCDKTNCHLYINGPWGKKIMLCFEDNFVHWNKSLNKLMLSIPLLYKCSSLINLAQTCDIFLIDLVQANKLT